MLKKIKDDARAILLRRKARVRYKLKKDNKKPRLTVFVSNMHLYAQLVDDLQGKTLASASTVDREFKNSSLVKTSNKEAASFVGKLIAERSLKAGVTEVIFDRSGHLFHGKVKCLADAARETGLKF